MIESCLSDKTILSKATRIESLNQSHGSYVTLQMNNGASRRVNMRLEINDTVVKSILKVCKVILPHKLYESLNQDMIECFLKCNLEVANGGEVSGILSAD